MHILMFYQLMLFLKHLHKKYTKEERKVAISLGLSVAITVSPAYGGVAAVEWIQPCRKLLYIDKLIMRQAIYFIY
jgi:hypothetical protein